MICPSIEEPDRCRRGRAGDGGGGGGGAAVVVVAAAEERRSSARGNGQVRRRESRI